MGAEGRVTATTRYAWSSVAAELEAYYLELRGELPGARAAQPPAAPARGAGARLTRCRAWDDSPRPGCRRSPGWRSSSRSRAQHGGGHLPASEVVLRKLGHVTGYLVLTLLLLRALRRSGLAGAVPVAIVAALAYAASDEWHQSFVPGREATPRDVAIDGIGIGGAALAGTRTRLRELAA